SGLKSVISQPAAVVDIHPPMFDTMVAIHSAAKLPYRKGPKREEAGEGAGRADAARWLPSLLMCQPRARIGRCFARGCGDRVCGLPANLDGPPAPHTASASQSAALALD